MTKEIGARRLSTTQVWLYWRPKRSQTATTFMFNFKVPLGSLALHFLSALSKKVSASHSNVMSTTCRQKGWSYVYARRLIMWLGVGDSYIQRCRGNLIGFWLFFCFLPPKSWENWKPKDTTREREKSDLLARTHWPAVQPLRLPHGLRRHRRGHQQQEAAAKPERGGGGGGEWTWWHPLLMRVKLRYW